MQQITYQTYRALHWTPIKISILSKAVHVRISVHNKEYPSDIRRTTATGRKQLFAKSWRSVRRCLRGRRTLTNRGAVACHIGRLSSLAWVSGSTRNRLYREPRGQSHPRKLLWPPLMRVFGWAHVESRCDHGRSTRCGGHLILTDPYQRGSATKERKCERCLSRSN